MTPSSKPEYAQADVWTGLSDSGLIGVYVGLFGSGLSIVPVTSPANAEPAPTPTTEALQINAAINVFFMDVHPIELGWSE